MHLVVLAFQNKSQQPADLNLVVNDQGDVIHLADETRVAVVLTAETSASIASRGDTPVATDSALGSRMASLTGKRIENSAPLPWRFCATISPPFASTNCRAIDRPSPMPPGRVRGPR